MARLFSFGVDRPRTSRPVRRMFVKEPRELAHQFKEWASLTDLKRIVVSHGDVIGVGAREALVRAAADFE